ncbi:MAG: uracil-DNA glycosylase [Oscillospiraceae bacterium]|jgi:uracil-DNA glycosylase|nr:uracil-DNA glycosylase [Oscillospiraceae bacterium]
MIQFNNEWDTILEDEFKKAYYLEVREFLKHEYKTQKIHPSMYDIFNALKLASYSDIKAVILGQDPYHGQGQAHGLCFSVKKGVAPPPSLHNIFKEIHDDTGASTFRHGELTSWAKQGVLLLNTVLTVREGAPNSHKGKGWEIFTDNVISILSQRQDPIVFILWGANAKSKTALITNPNHLILTAAHPSPLSAHNGFFGCRHFSKTNEFLKGIGKSPINWEIDL